MSASAAFCFLLAERAQVLLTRLEHAWVKGLAHRFVYLENAENPAENYSSEVPPNSGTTAFANLVKESSEAAIQKLVRDLKIEAEGVIDGDSRRTEAEPIGTGWVCKIGDFYSVQGDMDDFLKAARIIHRGSSGRMIYLRDSYSLAREVWTAAFELIELKAIAQFPPDPNSRQCFEIIRNSD